MRAKTITAVMCAAAVLAGCGSTEITATDTASTVGVTETADTTSTESKTASEDDSGDAASDSDESFDDLLNSLSEDVPEHPIEDLGDGKYDFDGLVFDTTGLDIESQMVNDSKQIRSFIDNNGDIYGICYSFDGYTEITVEELADLYAKDGDSKYIKTIEAAGGKWIINVQSSQSWSWDLPNLETNETLFSSEDGDYMVSASNTYTNSEGSVATRSLTYASHDKKDDLIGIMTDIIENHVSESE